MDNEALARRLCAAQGRGDLEAYLELLTDDFTMHIPGRSRIAGEYHGKDEMRRHFREVAELSAGTFGTAVHAIFADDEHAVALIEATAERDGRPVSLPRVHVWHVRDGRFSELWLHPADQHAFDAYWGLRR